MFVISNATSGRPVEGGPGAPFPSLSLSVSLCHVESNLSVVQSAESGYWTTSYFLCSTLAIRDTAYACLAKVLAAVSTLVLPVPPTLM